MTSRSRGKIGFVFFVLEFFGATEKRTKKKLAGYVFYKLIIPAYGVDLSGIVP
jgi:hypothetical protein